MLTYLFFKIKLSVEVPAPQDLSSVQDLGSGRRHLDVPPPESPVPCCSANLVNNSSFNFRTALKTVMKQLYVRLRVVG